MALSEIIPMPSSMVKLETLTTRRAVHFQQLRVKCQTKPRPSKVVWKPPDSGKWKTNFDGAMFEDLNVAGIRVVVCNSQWEVLATLFEIIPMPSSMVKLETLTTRRAVHFCRHLILYPLIIFGPRPQWYAWHMSIKGN